MALALLTAAVALFGLWRLVTGLTVAWGLVGTVVILVVVAATVLVTSWALRRARRGSGP